MRDREEKEGCQYAVIQEQGIPQVCARHKGMATQERQGDTPQVCITECKFSVNKGYQGEGAGVD